MSTLKILILIIMFCLSAGSFIIGYLQSKEKGFLYNNSYIYSSKEERVRMNKKPYYRQSSVVFTIIASMFLLTAIEIIHPSKLLFSIIFLHVIVIIIYAIASSIIIARNEGEK